MNGFRIFLFFLVTIVVNNCATAMQAYQKDPLKVLNYFQINDSNDNAILGYDKSRINSTPFKIGSLRTVDDQQFTTFYDENGNVSVARRTLGSPTWNVTRTQFTSNNIDDAHNVISFGLDGDGYLHMSWGQHVDDLLYTRSTAPVTNGGTMNFIGQNVGNAAAINNMTGTAETGVTYPNFYTTPTGDLLFYHRDRVSGNGISYLKRFNNQTNQWSDIKAPFFTNKDSPDASIDYNTYPVNMVYDQQGGLHATWTFRYNADSPGGYPRGLQTNENLYYGYSPDDGTTWYRDRFGFDAYPDVITKAESELILDIPEGSSLINSGTMDLDRYNRPALASFWAPGRDHGDGTAEIMFAWQQGATWKTSEVTRSPHLPGSFSPYPGRPQLIFDDKNRAFVIYNDSRDGNGIKVAYSESSLRNDWVHIDLTKSDFGTAEFTIDRTRFERDGVLSIFQQPVDGDATNGGSPINIVEWDAKSFFDRPRKAVYWRGTENDHWDNDRTTNWNLGRTFEHRDHVIFNRYANEKNVNLTNDAFVGNFRIESNPTDLYRFRGFAVQHVESLYVSPNSRAIFENSGLKADRVTLAAGSTLRLGSDNVDGEFELNGRLTGSGTLAIGNGTTVIRGNNTAFTGPIYVDGDLYIADTDKGAPLGRTYGSTVLRSGGTLHARSEIGEVNESLLFHGGSLAVSGQASSLEWSGPMKIQSADADIRLGAWTHRYTRGGKQMPGSGLTISGEITGSNGHDLKTHVDLLSTMAISGRIRHNGDLIKTGGGSLELLGDNTYQGKTSLSEGRIVLRNDAIIRGTEVNVAAGTVLESNKAQIATDLNAKANGTVRISPTIQSDAKVVSIEAETMTLGKNWSEFDPLRHAAGEGTYDGADLSVSAIQYADDQDAGSVAGLGHGIATARMSVPATDYYQLYSKVIAPSHSGLADGDMTTGDPATATVHGNDSFYTSRLWYQPKIIGALTESNNGLLALNGEVDVAQWTLLSQGQEPEDGVAAPSVRNSPEYRLIAGNRDFSIGGREVGTIVDGFVFSTESLNAGELEAVLAGDNDTGDALVVNGDFTLDSGSTLEMSILGPNLYSSLRVNGQMRWDGTLDIQSWDGFSPSNGDAFDLFDFTSLIGDFDNILLPTLANNLSWDTTQLRSQGIVSVSNGFNLLAVPEPASYALAILAFLALVGKRRRL